jgi:hypothetical protein
MTTTIIRTILLEEKLAALSSADQFTIN